MNQEKKVAVSSDEIDIRVLIISILKFLHKNFVVLSVFAVLGVGTAIAIYALSKKVYESKMILQSDILTESYAERITESLDRLIKEDNMQVLSVRLNITEEEAANINKIEIESVKQTTASKEKEESIFIITCEIKDKSILPKLQDGIISLLRNNEFVKIRVKQRETYYTNLIAKIQEEINSLDSLKKRLFQGKPVYGKSAEMMLVEPTSIYSKIIDLNKEQINYKNALELVNSIQLVEGFIAFQKPAKPKLSIALIGGFVGGMLLAFCFLAARWARQTIKES
ncbi:MAG: hypothetical protein KF856_03035 [Cyclobacteriaceae bacterium]|nr:hypothetical protein [Cyclobacteriaceae bacterium]